MKNHTLIALDSNGSAVTASDVIVLNPVDDSVCNLQCAVGWYDVEYGNAAPFLCAANTEDRTSREGTATYPITCTSALTFCIAMDFALSSFVVPMECIFNVHVTMHVRIHISLTKSISVGYFI